MVLFHRPEGVMAYTHSHHCWVAVAPVRGVETHQRWDAVRHEDGRAELRLVEDRAMRRGEVATLVPPGDIHNHGHVLGTGASPYSLILLGDDMYLFERNEYFPQQGTWRKLAPVIQAGRTADRSAVLSSVQNVNYPLAARRRLRRRSLSYHPQERMPPRRRSA